MPPTGTCSGWRSRRPNGLLSQLDTDLGAFIVSIASIQKYYVVAGRFADRAMAGWRGDPSVSDNEFVIATYQASQINGVGTQ